MKTIHCAAVDLGATSGRVIVGSWNSRRLELTEIRRFPNSFHELAGRAYWNLGGLWHEVRAGLVEARKRFPKLASIGIDTWGVDHVLVDDDGRLVYPPHAYRDSRTQPGLKRLGNTRAALERVYQATGIPNVFYNTSLQLEETVASSPAVTDSATRCLFLPDYFNFLLSGRMENEISMASTTQLLDVHTGDWSRATLDHFHIPPQWFTKPIKADTVLGSAKRVPELKGVKVVAVAGHDTASAYAAMPSTGDGDDLYISSGTWSLVGFESDTPLLGPDALAARVANERMGDGRFRPLTNVIGLWLLEQTLRDLDQRPCNDREWAALVARASERPAPARLLDTSDSAFVNPKSMRAAVDAQLKKHRQPIPQDCAGYVRLICDSLGRGHAEVAATFQKLSGRSFQRILMVGGGSRNTLLCQATADAAGIPLHAFELEGTAVGNIASQLVALKAVKNLAAFRGLLARRISPRIHEPTSR